MFAVGGAGLCHKSTLVECRECGRLWWLDAAHHPRCPFCHTKLMLR